MKKFLHVSMGKNSLLSYIDLHELTCSHLNTVAESICSVLKCMYVLSDQITFGLLTSPVSLTNVR